MKKEKLKLEELAAYLPYAVRAKFVCQNKTKGRFAEIGTIGAVYSNCSIVCYDTVNATPDKFVLLLHPLEYFRNCPEIMENFSEYDLEHFILSFNVGGGFIRAVNCFEHVSYEMVQLFLKHHIDIFNLLPRKLAIPIKKQKP